MHLTICSFLNHAFMNFVLKYIKKLNIQHGYHKEYVCVEGVILKIFTNTKKEHGGSHSFYK